jgi:hypothetical protein
LVRLDGRTEISEQPSKFLETPSRFDEEQPDERVRLEGFRQSANRQREGAQASRYLEDLPRSKVGKVLKKEIRAELLKAKQRLPE